MNIVWIEDFGGAQPLPADSKTLVPMFQGLIEREIFYHHWNDEQDLLAEPSILSDFFEKHSNHKIQLLKNVFDYLDGLANGDFDQHDIFVIDINLARGVNSNRSLPDGFEEADKSEFHRKAGFYIYNDLIRKGTPPRNVCFLTGEKDTTLEFVEHCKNSLTPKPRAFEKSDSEYAKFREWVDERRNDHYLALRRAVIDGCDYLRQCVEADESVIQFRRFIRPSDGRDSTREVSREEIYDYLDTLKNFLPAAKPDNESDRERLYRLFVRALAHEWEEKASPEYLKKLESDSRSYFKALRTLGWIMKNARNWMSHTNVINKLLEVDVAYLLFANMRAMFCWEFRPARFEEQLLWLLSSGTKGPEPELKDQEVRAGLVASYMKAKNACQNRRVPESQHFARMINNLSLAGLADENIDYRKTLFQMFWHGLVPVELGRFKKGEKGGKQHLMMFGNFNFSADSFRADLKVDKRYDFLYRFACAIYPHSFKA